MLFFFFFKQKTAYEMRISDWSSDVCSSDLATAIIAAGILTFGDALKVLDRKIVLTIVMALALGAAMQETGGATLIAHVLTELMAGASPGQVLSAFFLLLALLSHVLSPKATAVLFTPIAVENGRDSGRERDGYEV